MSQHDLAFTVVSFTDKDVNLSTHRTYTDDDGEVWVETANGKVRQRDIDKAKRPVRTSREQFDRYGNEVDVELDAEINELLEAKRREKFAENTVALERKANITLPKVDARGFQVGEWYRLRFEQVNAGTPLRMLIGNVQEEEVAVERKRTQTQERPANA